MAGKRKSTSWWKVAGFVLLVIVSGYALSATGHFDNPFAALSELTQQSAMDNLLNGQPQALSALSGDTASGAPPVLSASSSDSASGSPPVMSASDGSASTLPPLSALPSDDEDDNDEAMPDVPAGRPGDVLTSARGHKPGEPKDFAGRDPLSIRPPDGDFGPSGRDTQVSIQWSEIGDVLFDLWFLFAVAAVVIVLQKVFSLARSQFKKRLPRSAAA